MSLKAKTISGVFWTFGQQTTVQGINFFIQILLARILLPEAFGVIAMLQVFISIGNSLAEGGMASSLIRVKSPNQTDYSTVFFINIAVSILVYLLLFLSAPFIAEFYREPELSPIVKVYSLIIIVQAFNTVQTTKLTKEMNFKLQMYMQIPSVVISGIVGVILAESGFGVWSLIWMQLVNVFLFTLFHWTFTKWRPRIVVDKESIRYHLNFGYKLTVSGLISTLYSNIYRIIIGKYYSAIQLGFYQQANALSMFPVNNLSKALSKVSYPVFSSLQDDPLKMRSAYLQIGRYLFWIICPLMIFLIVFAKPIFLIVLTEKWLPAVPYFQILSSAAVFYPHSLYSLNILAAKGRTDLHLKIEVYKKVIGLVILLCLLNQGVEGIVIASALGMFSGTLINSYYCGQLINCPIGKQFRHLLPFLLLSGILVGLSYVLDSTFLTRFLDSVLVQLLILGTLFFGTYVLLSIKFRLVEPSLIYKQLKLKKQQ